MTHKEYADSLRMIADFFERHVELVLPHDAAELAIFNVHDKATLRPWIAALGSIQKGLHGDVQLKVMHTFGHITLTIYISRGNVCKLRVLGTKKVIEKVPIQFEEREKEVEITTWDCEPLLTEI